MSFCAENLPFYLFYLVPCELRVAALKNDSGVAYESLEIEGDDGWMLAIGGDQEEEIPDMDIPDMLEPSNPPVCPVASTGDLKDEDPDDIPDMDDFSDDDLEEDDPV